MNERIRKRFRAVDLGTSLQSIAEACGQLTVCNFQVLVEQLVSAIVPTPTKVEQLHPP